MPENPTLRGTARDLPAGEPQRRAQSPGGQGQAPTGVSVGFPLSCSNPPPTPGRQGGQLPNVLLYPPFFFIPCFQTGFPSCWMWFKTNPPPVGRWGCGRAGCGGRPTEPPAGVRPPWPRGFPAAGRRAFPAAAGCRVPDARRGIRSPWAAGRWGSRGAWAEAGVPVSLEREPTPRREAGGRVWRAPLASRSPTSSQPRVGPKPCAAELPPRGWGRVGPGQGAWRDVEGRGGNGSRELPPTTSSPEPVLPSLATSPSEITVFSVGPRHPGGRLGCGDGCVEVEMETKIGV